jgi:hypothetical protein
MQAPAVDLSARSWERPKPNSGIRTGRFESYSNDNRIPFQSIQVPKDHFDLDAKESLLGYSTTPVLCPPKPKGYSKSFKGRLTLRSRCFLWMIFLSVFGLALSSGQAQDPARDSHFSHNAWTLNAADLGGERQGLIDGPILNEGWSEAESPVFSDATNLDLLDSEMDPEGTLYSSIVASLEEPVPRFKPQALQRVAVSGGWLGATRREDLSQSFAEAKVTVGVPLGSLENILAVTPGARIDWINASQAIEVPSTLYDFGIDLFHTRRIAQRWKFLGLVRPSLRSDLVTSRAPTRILALALLQWEAVPDTATWAIGAVYLGRPDLPVLPAVGFTWTPDPTRKLELQFPRSRLFKRIAKDGARSETWASASIGIGGNTWAVLSDQGRTEEIALRDIRLTLGVERIVAGGGGWFAETGLALDRRLENLANGSNITLSNGLLFSAGWAY